MLQMLNVLVLVLSLSLQLTAGPAGVPCGAGKEVPHNIPLAASCPDPFPVLFWCSRGKQGNSENSKHSSEAPFPYVHYLQASVAEAWLPFSMPFSMTIQNSPVHEKRSLKVQPATAITT